MAVLASAAIVTAVGGSVGAARPQSGEPVTIRWFVGLGTGSQPEQLDAQQQVVDEFNASQDAIVLEVELVDNQIAFDTLATQIAAGDPPDIIGPIGIRGSNSFAGQLTPVPLQFSATSQTPADARQTSVDGLTLSAGHSAPEPVQFSAMSHTPAEARNGV